MIVLYSSIQLWGIYFVYTFQLLRFSIDFWPYENKNNSCSS